MQKVILALVVVVALIVAAAYFCSPPPPPPEGDGSTAVVGEPEDWNYVVVSSALDVAFSGTSAVPAWSAVVSSSAGVYVTGASRRGCTYTALVETFRVEKKPANGIVPATEGLDGSSPPIPPATDGVGNVHVNVHAGAGAAAPPWMPGSSSGSHGPRAKGIQDPPKAKPGYRVVFEVCTYCYQAPGDALFQKYLECEHFTWDAEAGWITFQESSGPSDAFKRTLDKWKQDHGPF